MAISRLPPKVRRNLEQGKLLDDVVERAQKVVDRSDIYKDDSKMEEHQIRAVLAMAEATDSFAVLENFLRYQMGRRPEWNFNDFGEEVLEDLEWLKEQAEQVVRREREREDLISAVHMDLVRRYLGHLVWWFVARRKEEERKKERARGRG